MLTTLSFVVIVISYFGVIFYWMVKNMVRQKNDLNQESLKAMVSQLPIHKIHGECDEFDDDPPTVVAVRKK